MKRIGTGCILIGVVANPWLLSLLVPIDGFYFFGILEKSQGAWGFASLLLILGVDLLFVICGLIFLQFSSDVRKAFFAAVTLTIGTAFSLLLLELVVRIASPEEVFSPYVQLRPYNHMELHSSLKGVSASSRNTTNKWGLRGDDPPQDWNTSRTIVTIGGSTTQCFYLDDAKTWPYRMQMMLRQRGINAWVGNAGVSGHSTRAHLLFVREILPKIKPEAAMILCGINDLWYSLDDASKNIETTPEKVGWKNKVLGYSRLAQVLYLWKIILLDKTVVLERSANENFEPIRIEHELTLEGRPEEIVPSIVSYRSNLNAMIEELRRQNIRPIFISQPVLYDTTSYWKGLVGWKYKFNNRKGDLSAATYASLVFQFNDTLRSVCKEQHVELIDAEKIIPHTTEFFYDLMHFTERGAERMAESISDRVTFAPR